MKALVLLAAVPLKPRAGAAAIALATLCGATGCAGLLPDRPGSLPPSPHCRALDTWFVDAGYAGRAAGALAIGGAVGSLAASGAAQTGLRVAALGAGALAAASALVQAQNARAYVSDCTRNDGTALVEPGTAAGRP